MKEKYLGCALIAINNRNQLMLHLRDDKPEIPFPNMWQFPGGRVENNETPEEAIRREICEEWDGFNLQEVEFLTIIPSGSYDNHIFISQINVDPVTINLQEGQEIRWFDIDEIKEMILADTDNITFGEFLKKHGAIY